MKFIVIFSEKLHQKKRKLTKHPLLRSVDHIIILSMHFLKNGPDWWNYLENLKFTWLSMSLFPVEFLYFISMLNDFYCVQKRLHKSADFGHCATAEGFLLSPGLSVQTSGYNCPSLRGTSILYLQCNYIHLFLYGLNLFCHLKQKCQSLHFHLHFHHETPCQAWVGSKAPFPPERRPSSSAVCRGLQHRSSPFSVSHRLDQQSRRAIGSVLQAGWFSAAGQCHPGSPSWFTLYFYSPLRL